MALPETTNNVTTRRLGTALSALWDKTATTYVKKAGDTMTGRLTMEKPLSQRITGTGITASSSGSPTTYYPAKWNFDLDIATPSAGDCLVIQMPCAGSDYGVYMSTDNGTTYYPVAHGTGSTRMTTRYPSGAYICVVFEAFVSGNNNAGRVTDIFPLAGGTARTTLTSGCWRVINDYDSGNNYDRIYNAGGTFYAGATGCSSYSLVCLDSEGKFSKLVSSGTGTGTSKTINTTGKFKLDAVIFYYAGDNTAAANTLVSSTYSTYVKFPNLDTRYSHNHTTAFTTHSPLYIECTIDDDGYWSPTAKCITQILETGKYYIYLGQTYSTEYQLSLSESHPLYYYDGTNLTERPRLNKEDRTKLDGISDGANKVEASQTNGNIKIDGTETNVYTHPTTSGNKHIPSGGSAGQFLGWDSDGTAKWVNSPDTDTKVTQTADNSSTGTGFEVLFSATGDNTTRTETSKKSNKLTFQPSTGTLKATKFSGPLEGNASSASAAASGSALETAINSKAASDHTHSVKINGSTKTIAASGGTAVDLGYYVQYNNATQGLSDTYKSNARTNIGLGTSAVKDVPSSGNASTTQVVLGSDTRLSDARTPTNHASADTNFGIGTTSVYGHVKLATGDMNGAANVDGVAVSQNHTHSQYQLASDRVTSWSSTTTDAHYPSEKLVKTALDSKVPAVYVTGSIDASTTRYVKMTIPTDSQMRHYIITLNMSMAAWHDEWLFKTYNVGGVNRTSVSYLGYTVATHKWYGSDGADFYIEINNTSAASQSYKFSVAAIDLSSIPTLSKVDTLPEGFTEIVVTGTIAEKLRVARQLSVDLSSTSTTNTTFDGSANVSIKNTGTLPVTKGGTGKTTVTAAEYNLLSKMGTDLSANAIADNYRFVFATTSPSETNGRLAGYRTATAVWSWVKDKISSVLDLTETSYGGNAATATKATQDSDGNVINTTYLKELYQAEYGVSTFADIYAAIKAKKTVYCKVPGAVANGSRMAFLAYLNVADPPTSSSLIEFQYYRSNSSGTGDSVFVYTITNNNNTWTTVERAASSSVKGDAESSYRTGQVNLTPANLGISATTSSVTVGSTTFNKYTHPTTSGNKHVPSGGSSGQFLGWDSDGTAKWVANPNTDTKVTSSANHYTPDTASGSDKTASASGATAAWSIDVVKGITINTDGKGHITGLSVTSGKIPGNPNTDTKVKATAKDDDVNYKILATASASPTSGNATEAVYDTDITLNPSTNTITANISGNAGTATDLASGSVLSVSKGGTGKSSVTNSNFLVGAGTGALVEKTPAEVLALIGAQAALTEMTTTEVTDFVSALGEL